MFCLFQLQEKYDSDMKIMTLKNEEQEKELTELLKDNKSLKSLVADTLKKQDERNENEHNLQLKVQELKNELKVSKEHTINFMKIL
jgi:hypothetical protein